MLPDLGCRACLAEVSIPNHATCIPSPTARTAARVSASSSRCPTTGQHQHEDFPHVPRCGRIREPDRRYAQPTRPRRPRWNGRTRPASTRPRPCWRGQPFAESRIAVKGLGDSTMATRAMPPPPACASGSTEEKPALLFLASCGKNVKLGYRRIRSSRPGPIRCCAERWPPSHPVYREAAPVTLSRSDATYTPLHHILGNSAFRIVPAAIFR